MHGANSKIQKEHAAGLAGKKLLHVSPKPTEKARERPSDEQKRGESLLSLLLMRQWPGNGITWQHARGKSRRLLHESLAYFGTF
jgi:hypothetical protein